MAGLDGFFLRIKLRSSRPLPGNGGTRPAPLCVLACSCGYPSSTYARRQIGFSSCLACFSLKRRPYHWPISFLVT